MWLRDDLLDNADLNERYSSSLQNVVINASSPTMKVVEEELQRALQGLIAKDVSDTIVEGNILVLGTPDNSIAISSLDLDDKMQSLGDEGFIIENKILDNKKCIVVAANTDIGVLYGAFHFIRLLQTNQSIDNLKIKSSPSCKLHLVNHWDNADRSIERGYAGLSIWEWSTLPEYKHPRYTDLARVNVSLGINGIVINNVNADPLFITEHFLEKISIIADVF